MKLLKPLLLFTLFLVLLSNLVGCGPDVQLEPGENLKKLPETTRKVEETTQKVKEHEGQLKETSKAKESLQEIVLRTPPQVSPESKVNILLSTGPHDPKNLVLGQIDKDQLVFHSDALNAKLLATKINNLSAADPLAIYHKFSGKAGESDSLVSMDRDLFIYASRFRLDEGDSIRTNGMNLTIVAEEVEIYGKIILAPTSDSSDSRDAGNLSIATKTLITGPKALINISGAAGVSRIEKKSWKALTSENRLSIFKQVYGANPNFGPIVQPLDPFSKEMSPSIKRSKNTADGNLERVLKNFKREFAAAILSALKSVPYLPVPGALELARKNLVEVEAIDQIHSYLLENCLLKGRKVECLDVFVMNMTFELQRISDFYPLKYTLFFTLPETQWREENTKIFPGGSPGRLQLVVGQAKSDGLRYLQSTGESSPPFQTSVIRAELEDKIQIPYQHQMSVKIRYRSSYASAIESGRQPEVYDRNYTRYDYGGEVFTDIEGVSSTTQSSSFDVYPVASNDESLASVDLDDLARGQAIFIERGTGYEGDWKNIHETLKNWNLPGYNPELEPFETFKRLAEDSAKR